MRVILLTAGEAQAVAGDYGINFRLDPTEVGEGVYILPERVLDTPEYAPAKPLLSSCPIVEHESLGA